MFILNPRPDNTMVFQRLFNWIFAVSDNEQPYRWTLDSSGNKSKIFSKNNGHVSEEHKQYKEKAEKSIKESLTVLSSDGWKLKRASEYGTVYMKRYETHGTVFKFVGTIDIPAPKLLSILFHNIEKSPDWNECVENAKVLLSIDENTNIAQFTSYKVPFVINRYFVNLRYTTAIQDAYIHSSFSIDYPARPENSQYIRGEQRFCTYVIKPSYGNPHSSEVTWLFQTTLKGHLPQWIVDQTVTIGMCDHIKCIHKVKSKLK